jgi:hypothetical protein
MTVTFTKLRPSGPKRYVKNFYLVEVALSDGTRKVIEVNGEQQLSESEAKIAIADQLTDINVVAAWQHKYLLTGHRVSVSEKKIQS